MKYLMLTLFVTIACLAKGQTNLFSLYSSGAWSGGSGDLTNVVTPQLKLQATSGYIRVPHLSASATVSAVYNFETGKNVYWGEPTDNGTYIFRGRNLSVEGYVGIGLSSPTQVLDVLGRVKFRSGGSSSGIWFTGDTGTESAFLGQTGNTSTDPFGISHGGAWRFVVDQYGYVGVGTMYPEAKLHVNSTIMSADPTYPSINVRLDGSSVPVIRFTRDIDATCTSYHNAFIGQFFNSNYSEYSLGIGASIDNTQNGSNPKVMTITMSGDVGIGTTSPDHKLTVNGTIHTKEVIVDLNVPAPDYVFEKDYDLLSLAETETYIKANKHLPEVPSAKEMEANGLNLKEMNLLLLKKVEELTLHLIEMNQKFENQQKEIEKLKK